MIDPVELDIAPRSGTASYRIGVIGAGKIVRECHLPAYRSAGWEVVRIASRSEASARDVAVEFGIEASTGDMLDVIRDERVEVVDISLPPHRHREFAEAALAAGKHVLLQKPMATTLEDARAIVEAADKAGRKLAVNQNGRWDPAMRACHELVRRGVFGTLVTASIEMRTRQPWQSFWTDAEHYPRLMLLGMSIHHLDQFRYLFGDPLEIAAFTATYPGQPWEGESIALYVLRFESGLMATGFDDGFPWIREWTEDYRIEGLDAIARGSIGWPTGGYSTLEFTTRDRPDSWIRPAFSGKWFPDAFAGTMGELFRAIETDTEPSISGADNLDTLRLIEAAYLSAAERRTVRLQEIPA
ncbi:MAG: Gfo/Idh/MocA family protein [Chloroflexota bacterium]